MKCPINIDFFCGSYNNGMFRRVEFTFHAFHISAKCTLATDQKICAIMTVFFNKPAYPISSIAWISVLSVRSVRNLCS